VGHELHVGGFTPGLPRPLGGRRLGRHRVDVEQHRGDVNTGDAVDEAVVRLVEERKVLGFEPLHEPDLPQRLRPVEAL
jgi:hypothetical protein